MIRRVITIEDFDDPRLADYRELREAHLRDVFIAESEVVLRVLLGRSRFGVRSLFLAAPKLERLAPLLRDVTAPVYVAEQAVLDRVVGFHIHRGVLAAGERQPVPAPNELLATLGDGPSRVVVLESLTNHDNVGGVFRNAAAFGADAVLYDAATCDPLYRKAIRVSVGGSLIVPFARAETSSEILEALRREGFYSVALTPRADAMDLTELCRSPLPDKLALWVGTEGAGLAASTLAAADAAVRIDIDPRFDSLNVATASGIALHAVRRAFV